MKRLLLGGLAAAMVLVSAPMAFASASYDTSGGCFFDTSSHETATNGAFVGVIGTQSATVTKTTPPALVSGTVWCKIQVDSVDAPGTTFSYGDVGTAGIQAGANQISFVAPEGSSVALCQQTVYAGGAETDPWDCGESTSLEIPPPVVWETLDNAFYDVIDPAICPTLAANAGSYGGVTIESDGDVIVPDPLDVGLNPFFDCPPYRV